MPHVSDLAIKLKYARERAAYEREQHERQRRVQLAQQLLQLAQMRAVHAIGKRVALSTTDLFGLDDVLDDREEHQQ